MKISANWLSDYVSHGLAVSDLAELLTMAGLEVDAVEPIGSSLEGVVVGHVMDVRQHPNADRLTVCLVDIGAEEPASIVCGAPNVAIGQKVPVATVGTKLRLPSRDNPDFLQEIELKKTKIRGELSFGMICAEDELGLSTDHRGIMVLDETADVGTAFGAYLQARGIPHSDTAIDVAITPNRPDAVCHFGIARDVAAVCSVPLVEPDVAIPASGGAAAAAFSVRIDAEASCPRYVGILVQGVKIEPSPAWMQKRLETIGLRPRNNVVDITNYVMYELGQPLHAFDFDQLSGAQIIVHETTTTTKFTTLDDKERELPVGTLMIADADQEIAIAGVMGGENSEVSEATTNVLIESAYFDPVKIRKTAKALQIQTDASYRFERGIDPTGQSRAAARAAQLMAEIAGGTIVPGMVDANPRPFSKQNVTLRPSRVERVLGVGVPAQRITSLLERIGFELQTTDSDRIECLIPAFRPDIEKEIDVIEEVARLIGYDSIPEPTRSVLPNQPVITRPERLLRDSTRHLLVGLGYREVVTNSMLSREAAESFRDEILPGVRFGGDVVETLNPVSKEMATLRPSLLPGVLRVAGHNLNRGQRTLQYFEFGNVQMKIQSDRSVLPGYTESECLLVLSSGECRAAGWDSPAATTDIFDLKGVTEDLLLAAKLPDVRFEPVYEASRVVSYRLDVFSGPTKVGVLGRVTNQAADAYDLRGDVFFLELDWLLVTELASPFMRRKYETFSRHPAVDRDIAVVAARTQPVGPMIDSIRKSGGDLLRHVQVFDLYEGDQISSDRKSIAFSLTFGSDKTLRDEDVDQRVSRIVSSLEREHGVKLRQ